MAQNSPVFESGLAYTRRASAAVTGGQLVEVTGAGTVGPAAAGSTKFLGTAAFDAAVGEDVTVHIGGVQRLIASGAVAAGDMVAASSAGKVATAAAPAVGAQVGVAINAAADGAVVETQMAR